MITGIIMASGFSRRMGQDKLLMDINGKKLIELTIEAAKKSKLNEILIVYRSKEIGSIAKAHNVKAVYNEKAKLGQSESIVLGIENSENNSYMFLVGDQPFINHELIDLLIEAHRENRDKIIIPSNNNELGTPTIFPEKFKRDLLNVKGDKGGRKIIQNNPKDIKIVDIKDEKLLKDIDTMEDYNKILMEDLKTTI